LVDRIEPIKRVDADDLEFHVLLFAAQEIDGALFPLEPLPEVDAGTIPNVENLAALGGSLAQC
jgi:hypothetical protein